jgi:hypothetical protein
VRAFSVRVRVSGWDVTSRSCCVVVRGFTDQLALVQVLLHGIFEQLGCDPAEMTGWSGKAGEGWHERCSARVPACETDAERRTCHKQEGARVDTSESSETKSTGHHACGEGAR